MRILMTADTVGGVWTYALDLARGLAPLGHTVTLATMGAPLSDAQWAEANALPNVEVRESHYKLEWMDAPWDDVARAGDWLLELERELHPDIVHLNGFAHGALPTRAPKLVVAHSCVLSWWCAVKGEDAPPEAWGCYHAAVRDGLRAADAVVAPTQAMADALSAHYGPLRNSVQVVANGRDMSVYHPLLGTPKEPFVLTAGRLWDEAKNVAALATVAPRLPWPVFVAGEGGEASPGLRPLGRLSPPDLARWMARASIYALPARYEPFGLSALEAAMSGCALVLGDIPSLREVWGNAALFVAPDDADALLAALQILIEDEDAQNEYALRARRRAQLYSLERMTEAYREIYRGLSRRENGIPFVA